MNPVLCSDFLFLSAETEGKHIVKIAKKFWKAEKKCMRGMGFFVKYAG